MDFLKDYECREESRVVRCERNKTNMILRIEQYKAMSQEEIEEMKRKIFETCTIDRMMEREYYPKFYNGCYGGIGQSLDVGYLFNLFYSEVKKTNENSESSTDKFNKVVLKARIVRYLGDNANGEFSCPVFDFVKRDVYDFIRINEYDGLESLEFDENAYRLDVIHKIVLDTSSTSDEKVIKIKDIYDKKFDECFIIDSDECITWLEGKI